MEKKVEATEMLGIKTEAQCSKSHPYPTVHTFPPDYTYGSSVTSIGNKVTENPKFKFENHREFKYLPPSSNWMMFSTKVVIINCCCLKIRNRWDCKSP